MGPLIVRFVRTWLPVIVVTGGILVIIIGGDTVALEGGAGIIGAGLSIWLFNWLFRFSTTNAGDRDVEEQARRFYDRHGVWPDEASEELLRRDAEGHPSERRVTTGGRRTPDAGGAPARRRRGH